MTTVHYRFAVVQGRRLFYREAGPADAPAVVLLHGFPTSSFMFRDLVPILADRYHVIAPDHLGFGLSDASPAAEFSYSFDALAALTASLLGQLGQPPPAARRPPRPGGPAPDPGPARPVGPIGGPMPHTPTNPQHSPDGQGWMFEDVHRAARSHRDRDLSVDGAVPDKQP